MVGLDFALICRGDLVHCDIISQHCLLSRRRRRRGIVLIFQVFTITSEY